MTDADGRVEFGILGELEVRRDGRPVMLQGAAQRALLAALLLHANRPVPVERLIDELWGPEAGSGAVKRLQVAVSRLRRVLTAGAGAQARMTWSPPSRADPGCTWRQAGSTPSALNGWSPRAGARFRAMSPRPPRTR